MQPLATLLAVATSLAAAAIVVATSGALPARVATHFGPGGAANGWMSRDAYVVAMALATLLAPLLAWAGTAWVPRRWPRFSKPAMRDYWLAPARRASTVESLDRYGLGLAALTALLLAGVHVTVLLANGRSPPELAPLEIVAVLVPFGGAIAALVLAMAVRFRRPRS